jgi:micrococcal nuclease
MAHFASPHRRSRTAGLSGPGVIYAVCIGLLVGYYAPGWKGRIDDAIMVPAARSAAYGGLPVDRLSASFGLCRSGGGTNCVVDGDTFWFQGAKVRVADIDTPETHPPRCAGEAALGAQATYRLRVLLNAGPFSLESIDRDTDRYGRALRIVTRGGTSIGDHLVAKGLARTWDGRRHPWC